MVSFDRKLSSCSMERISHGGFLTIFGMSEPSAPCLLPLSTVAFGVESREYLEAIPDRIEEAKKIVNQ